MNITDMEILKNFSDEWDELFHIAAAHKQEIYGKPLDKKLLLTLLDNAKFYNSMNDKVSAIESFIEKYFKKGNETYDICAYEDIIDPD